MVVVTDTVRGVFVRSGEGSMRCFVVRVFRFVCLSV